MSEDAKAWQEGMKRYLKWVEAQHSTMRLLGQPRPVPLEGIFTDVYVLDKPSASRWVDIATLRAHYAGGERHHTGQRHNGMEMVQREPRLFILGKPGAGKTTFLRYVALQAARQKPIKQVPIFVSLKELADSGQDVLSFVVEQVAHGEVPDAAGFVKRLLKAGRALVLLDGLDEAQQTDFNLGNLLLDINRLTNRYPESQYLVTCRLAATEYQFERFAYVEMADFTQAQIDSFVSKWFVTDATQGKRFLDELAKPDHKGLKELAQVPLLLTLLCLAFGETLSFPQRRVEVYNEAVEALLRKWDVSRGIRRDEVYKHLSPDRKRQMLARLAFDTFESGHYFIPQVELEAKIVEWMRQLPTTKPDEEIYGQAILKSIEAQHGLFVERARQVYSFAHLSFQEYFTAKYIVDMGDITLRFLMTQITELRWREVFLLVASLLPNADRFFDSFLAALDDLVADQPPLVELLEWAEGKTGTAQSAYKRESLRTFYLVHTLDLARERALSFARARARVLEYAVASVFTLTHDLGLDLTLMTNLVRALDRALDSARALALYGASPLDSAHALHCIRTLTLVIEQSKALSEEIGLAHLCVDLKSLIIPDAKKPAEVWQGLADNLHTLIVTEFQLNLEWSLKREEAECLTTYLAATHLLLECLDVAIVSDREGIKAKLLRPPRGAGGA